jgi:tRNA-dihydrouridine synthase A
LLSQVDSRLFGETGTPLARTEVAEQFIPYIERAMANGNSLYGVVKHLLGLFHGERGGKQFRRHLSENGHKREAGVETFREALKFVTE